MERRQASIYEAFSNATDVGISAVAKMVPKQQRRQITIASMSKVSNVDDVASLMRRIQQSALDCDTHALCLHLEEVDSLSVSFELVRALHMGKTIAALTRCSDERVAIVARALKAKWVKISKAGLLRLKRLHPKSSMADLMSGKGIGCTSIGFTSADSSGIDPNFVLPDAIRRPRGKAADTSSSSTAASRAGISKPGSTASGGSSLKQSSSDAACSSSASRNPQPAQVSVLQSTRSLAGQKRKAAAISTDQRPSSPRSGPDTAAEGRAQKVVPGKVAAGGELSQARRAPKKCRLEAGPASTARSRFE